MGEPHTRVAPERGTGLPCSSPGWLRTRRSPATALASRRSPSVGPCGPGVGSRTRALWGGGGRAGGVIMEDQDQ